MRLLFLDFDGVLNNWEHNTKHGGALRNSPEGPVCVLDPANVAHLNKIVAATDCTIVYSTAHRKGQFATFRCWESLRHAGATFQRPRWSTPDLAHESATSRLIVGASRGSEIAAWLCDYIDVPDELRKDVPPRFVEGLRFVVLDDLSDAWPPKGWEGGGLFIQTRLDTGLTEADAEKAIAWLLEAFIS